MSDSVFVPSTSRSLIQRAIGECPQAWERLSLLYTPLVYSWCRRTGLQPHDAADVVQDVFRALLRGLKQFRHDRSGDSFRGWLWTITRNKMLDHRRAEQREPRAAGGSSAQRRFAELPDSAPEENDPAQSQAVRSELARRAMELMRQDFETTTWQAFWLTGVEGKTAAQAAETLGLSPAAVYMAKSRVLRRLREELSGLDVFG
jgi:RNA polymerase sigma-70 factor (ECF subfamily)